MWNVSAETHFSLCECKIWFAHAQESKDDLKCETNPLPLQLRAFNSPINIELKLFQDCQRFSGQTAIPCCFLGLSLWTYRYITNILMIPNKHSSGLRKLSANA